jgi:hypothetical protein
LKALAAEANYSPAASASASKETGKPLSTFLTPKSSSQYASISIKVVRRLIVALTMKMMAYDGGVLDSYCTFIKQAARLLDIQAEKCVNISHFFFHVPLAFFGVKVSHYNLSGGLKILLQFRLSVYFSSSCQS